MSGRLISPTRYNFRHFQKSLDRPGRELIWGSGLGELTDPIHEDDRLFQEVMRQQFHDGWNDNALVDEGEEAILDVFFRNGTAPTFYFALYDDTPVDTDTLATLTNEVSGTGYARISVARNSTDWPTLGLDSGDYQVESVTKQFSAGGTWTDATTLALVSPASGTSGTFYCWSALSATRTLGNGDTLDVSMDIKAA